MSASSPIPWTRWVAPILLLALAAACGGGGRGEPAAGVRHLDLRLADGRSPSRALAAALAVQEIRPSAQDPESLGPWTLRDARLAGAPQAARLAPTGDRPPALVHSRPIDAREIQFVELLAQVRKPTDATVSWEGGSITIEAQPDERPRLIRFALGTEAAWQGRVEGLTVTPSEEAIPVQIHALRLVPMGFQWGSEPLSEESRLGGGGADEPGDAGLRRRGWEARRAWPSDAGVPLFATVDRVPRGAQLAVAVAPGNRALGQQPDALWAAVDARRPGGDWRRLETLELPPGRAPAAARWRPLTVDLADFGGDTVELRFVAARGELPRVDRVEDRSDPRHEQVLWGAPEVLGEPPESRRPSVLLVTLDTTRADALGGSWTPFLDRFAEDAIVYADAWSACNSTTPSHASILTGLHVEEHGAITNYHLLGPEVDTLAERLRAVGYHTAAAVSVPHIQAGVGFGQGFDRFALAQPGAEIDGALRPAVGRALDRGVGGPTRPSAVPVGAPVRPPHPVHVARGLGRGVPGADRPPAAAQGVGSGPPSRSTPGPAPPMRCRWRSAGWRG